MSPFVHASERVRIERDGAVVRVQLDRPPLNVLDYATIRELYDRLCELSTDRSLKTLVLTGAGRAFCAGVDVADHTPDRAPEMLASFHALLLLLLEFPAPTIALVNGAALGGGCELFLACDVTIARSDAKVGLPEIKLGAFPPFAAVVLPRLLGRQRALDLILSGRTLSGADALACGLVQHCVSADAFEDFVRQYVNALTASSGPVLRLAKRALLDGQASQVGAALSSCETVYLNQLMQLSDAREGITAFMEKRAPVWQEA